MKIEHVAIWCKHLESSKNFYCTYFNGTANKKYQNTNTGFQSYFIRFSSGTRLELMHQPGRVNDSIDTHSTMHIAFALGTAEAVDALTNRLKVDNFQILSGPRTTGDGYYETQFLDPEGNVLEITI